MLADQQKYKQMTQTSRSYSWFHILCIVIYIDIVYWLKMYLIIDTLQLYSTWLYISTADDDTGKCSKLNFHAILPVAIAIVLVYTNHTRLYIFFSLPFFMVFVEEMCESVRFYFCIWSAKIELHIKTWGGVVYCIECLQSMSVCYDSKN